VVIYLLTRIKTESTVKEFKKMSVLKSICPKCGTIYYGCDLVSQAL
jgi:uncharacterized OB-fold protein